MLTFESQIRQEGFDFVIGIDEAGRGPLAGPVVASAVLLKQTDFHSPIRDSKKLSSKQRETAFEEIGQKAYVGVGIVSESVIDEANILRAAFMAMEGAVLDLVRQLPGDVSSQNDFSKKVCLLVDGNQFISALPYAYRTIVKGDEKVFSISAASIIAKVTRDRMLDIYDRIFPEYGFQKHKGYPTLAHRSAIKTHGMSPIHRKTFSKKFCG
ncbi:MAG: ribonuclease HII [Candidatus Omnitrophica bacterium]|nr:ribonuclease HII [Candidatus Omnitrophota bacterium]